MITYLWQMICQQSFFFWWLRQLLLLVQKMQLGLNKNIISSQNCFFLSFLKCQWKIWERSFPNQIGHFSSPKEYFDQKWSNLIESLENFWKNRKFFKFKLDINFDYIIFCILDKSIKLSVRILVSYFVSFFVSPCNINHHVSKSHVLSREFRRTLSKTTKK